MSNKVQKNLCILLYISILRERLTHSYMHNLETNFDKVRLVTRTVVCDHLLSDGNFTK